MPENPTTKNQHIIDWVQEMADLCQPETIYWGDGSEEERAQLTAQAESEGIIQKLNQEKWPGCYYH